MNANGSANLDIKIYLLGGFEVFLAGHTIKSTEWTRHNAAQLLQRLAYERRMTKEQAMEFLWPEANPDHGANNLYQVLYILRRTIERVLGEGAAVEVFSFENGILRLNENVLVDARCFSELYAKALDENASIQSWQQALAYYRGDFLPDELYEEWTTAPRMSLRRKQRQVRIEMAALYRKQNLHEQAIESLLPLVETDATDESVQRELMGLFALTGRRHSALRQYQLCVQALVDELGVAPESETEALYTEILNGDFAPPQPVRTHENAQLPNEVEQVRLADPMAGRQVETRQLCEHIRMLSTGKGQTILIAGDSGIGKTRLAFEGLSCAAENGMALLYGAAYEEEGQLPYQPFVEAFDRYISLTGDLNLVNPITHFQPIGTSDPQLEHSALFREIARFLTVIARRQPLVLFIDDLHAADEDSLHLFHYLARQTRTTAMVLLASYRTDLENMHGSPFNTLLNSLYRDGYRHTLSLKPLNQPEAAELISRILGDEVNPSLLEAIYELTEGNPFFIQEITRSIQNSDRLDERQGRESMTASKEWMIPNGLHDILNERVHRLGSKAADALATAAVIGREFSFNTLRQLVDLPDPSLLDILDRAISSRLIEEAAEGYHFLHTLIRYNLYHSLSRDRRAWLHRRTAEVIESQRQNGAGLINPQAETLAFHYLRSDNQEKALPYLLQSGQKAAEVFALEVASDQYESALSLFESAQLQDDAMHWMILEQLGWWAIILADTPRAVERFEQALAIEPDPGAAWQPSLSDRVRLHRAVSRTLITTGQMAAAERHLKAALEEADQEASETGDQAYLLYDLALWYWHANEYQRSLELATQCLEIARRLDDRVALARAYEMLALATHSLGDWQQGIKFEQQRASLAGPVLDVTEAFDVHLCLWEYHLFGDLLFDEVQETVESTLQQAERMGAPRAMALCKCFQGALEYQSGSWKTSESALRESIRLYQQIGAAAGEAMASHRLGVLLTAEGRLDEAMHIMESGVVAAERALMRFHCLTRLYAAMAANRVQAHDLEGADHALSLGLTMSARHGHCSTCDSLLYPAAVSLRIAQGDLPAAESFCQQLGQAANRYDSQLWRAMADQARGELASARGDIRLAEDCYTQAQQAFQVAGYAHGSARCLNSLAELYRDNPGYGDMLKVQRLQEQAQQIYTRLLNG